MNIADDVVEMRFSDEVAIDIEFFVHRAIHRFDEEDAGSFGDVAFFGADDEGMIDLQGFCRVCCSGLDDGAFVDDNGDEVVVFANGSQDFVLPCRDGGRRGGRSGKRRHGKGEKDADLYGVHGGERWW